MKKQLLERLLGTELTAHLGYTKGEPAGRGNGNSRNGYSAKNGADREGAVELAIPARPQQDQHHTPAT
ncbi:MAG: transposase [Acetobacteraceae bacterium]|nr:transposase [Acetobacteraceae bacterium]